MSTTAGAKIAEAIQAGLPERAGYTVEAVPRLVENVHPGQHPIFVTPPTITPAAARGARMYSCDVWLLTAHADLDDALADLAEPVELVLDAIRRSPHGITWTEARHDTYSGQFNAYVIPVTMPLGVTITQGD